MSMGALTSSFILVRVTIKKERKKKILEGETRRTLWTRHSNLGNLAKYLNIPSHNGWYWLHWNLKLLFLVKNSFFPKILTRGLKVFDKFPGTARSLKVRGVKTQKYPKIDHLKQENWILLHFYIIVLKSQGVSWPLWPPSNAVPAYK